MQCFSVQVQHRRRLFPRYEICVWSVSETTVSPASLRSTKNCESSAKCCFVTENKLWTPNIHNSQAILKTGLLQVSECLLKKCYVCIWMETNQPYGHANKESQTKEKALLCLELWNKCVCEPKSPTTVSIFKTKTSKEGEVLTHAHQYSSCPSDCLILTMSPGWLISQPCFPLHLPKC